MHLPFVNLGAKFQPNSYVSPMKSHSPSLLQSSPNLKELQRWYTQERDKAFTEIVLFFTVPH